MQTGFDLRNFGLKSDVSGVNAAEKSAKATGSGLSASRAFSANLDDAMAARAEAPASRAAEPAHQPNSLQPNSLQPSPHRPSPHRQSLHRHVPLVAKEPAPGVERRSEPRQHADSAHVRDAAADAPRHKRTAPLAREADRPSADQQDASIPAEKAEAHDPSSEQSSQSESHAGKQHEDAAPTEAKAAEPGSVLTQSSETVSTQTPTVMDPALIEAAPEQVNSDVTLLAPAAAIVASNAEQVASLVEGDITLSAVDNIKPGGIAVAATEAALADPVDLAATAKDATSAMSTKEVKAAALSVEDAFSSTMDAQTKGDATIALPVGTKAAQAKPVKASAFAGLEAAPSGVSQEHNHENNRLVDRLSDIFAPSSSSGAVASLVGSEKAQAVAASAPGFDVARPTPLQMVPIEIGMQAVRGVTKFAIRLDPAELGRVEVNLEINDQGEVNATMIVDRVETLQMLRRDASSLQQALEQAGLKQPNEGGLSFSLRGEGQNGQNQQDGQGRHGADFDDDAALKAQFDHPAMRRVMIPNSSLDLMI